MEQSVALKLTLVVFFGLIMAFIATPVKATPEPEGESEENGAAIMNSQPFIIMTSLATLLMSKLM